MADVLLSLSVVSSTTFAVDVDTIWPLNGTFVQGTSVVTSAFSVQTGGLDAGTISATSTALLTLNVQPGLAVGTIAASSAVNAAPGLDRWVTGQVQSDSSATVEFAAITFDLAAVESNSQLIAEFDVLSVGGLEPDLVQAASTVRLRRFDEWVNPAAEALHKPGLINLELIDKLGQLSDWKFEANFGDRQDNAVWSGYGVGYLDRLAEIYTQQVLHNPRFNLRLDVTVKGFASSWSKVNLNDLVNLRAAFVRYHGEVDRVDEWSNNY